MTARIPVRVRVVILAITAIVVAGIMLKQTVLSKASAVATTKMVYASDQASDERGEGFQIYIANSDGTGATRLTAISSHGGELYANIDPALSPDGTKIAFESNASGNARIVVISSTGTGWTTLTSGAYIDSSPAWSPNGKQIVFARAPVSGGGAKLYIMNSDGTGLTQLTTGASTINDSDPSWSPNGQTIAFDSNRTGSNTAVYTVNVDGTDLDQLTKPPAGAVDLEPSWSPNGQDIAFARDGASSRGIYVVDPSGANVFAITSGTTIDAWPTWSPDGSQLAFDRQSGQSDQARIYKISVTGASVTSTATTSTTGTTTSTTGTPTSTTGTTTTGVVGAVAGTVSGAVSSVTPVSAVVNSLAAVTSTGAQMRHASW